MTMTTTKPTDSKTGERKRIEVYQTDHTLIKEDLLKEEEQERFFNLSSGHADLDENPLTVEEFGRYYNLVGAEEQRVHEEISTEELLEITFERWNNTGMRNIEQSSAFRRANDDKRAVSMSTGDIVRINDELFIVDMVGFSKLEI